MKKHQLKVQEIRDDGVIIAMYSNSETGFFCTQIFSNREHLDEHATRHEIRVIEPPIEGEAHPS